MKDRSPAGDVDRVARARVRADEAKRRTIGLGTAAREFWRHPSPWLITAFLVGVATARVLVGGWELTDLWTTLLMVALFPVVEWVIHVCVLHWRPRRVGPLTIDPLLSRKHRAHHVDPRDLPLVFIPWPVHVWLLPLLLAVGLLAVPRAGLGLTFLTVIGLLGIGYEWTHYLIHSDYRPRTRLYRAIWRNHRLHHYKNEHYWFTVTTSGTADRVFGTCPDPGGVPVSPTARALHGTER